jgi:hypothetical protein
MADERVRIMRKSKDQAFGYVVRYDLNFAPHVRRGLFSLACCKPIVRKLAEEDSILVGFSSKERCPDLRVVYWARVQCKRERKDYWNQCPKRRWDNIYELDGRGFIVRENGYHGPNNGGIKGDMKCHSVLLTREYCCFGCGTRTCPGIVIPKQFQDVIKLMTGAHGHRRLDKLDKWPEFRKWVEKQAQRYKTKSVFISRRKPEPKEWEGWSPRKRRDICDCWSRYWREKRSSLSKAGKAAKAGRC